MSVFAQCGPRLVFFERGLSITRLIPNRAFDRQMEALEEFDVTLTFSFTPEHRGIQPTGRRV